MSEKKFDKWSTEGDIPQKQHNTRRAGIPAAENGQRSSGIAQGEYRSILLSLGRGVRALN